MNDDALRAAAEALMQEFCHHHFEEEGQISLDHVNGSAAWLEEAKACVTAYRSALPAPQPSYCPNIATGIPEEIFEAAQKLTVYFAKRNILEWEVDGVRNRFPAPQPAAESDSINPSVSADPSHVDDENVGDIPGEEGLVEAMLNRVRAYSEEKQDESIPEWGAILLVKDIIAIARPVIEAPLREDLSTVRLCYYDVLDQRDKFAARCKALEKEADDLRRQLESLKMASGTVDDKANEYIERCKSLERQLGEARERIAELEAVVDQQIADRNAGCRFTENIVTDLRRQLEEADQRWKDDCCALSSSLDKTRSQLREAREALKAHGEHFASCGKWREPGDELDFNPRECTCGLEKALSGKEE
jgi:chaperonin cofactor prefoldin